MSEDREVEGQTPSPGEEEVSDLPDDADDDEKADKESKDSFPASDPPSW